MLNCDDLAIYYTPGVAKVSLAIKATPELSYELTNRANTIAIITDGTRILGLGNVGPEAGMPVMEGKALLFKKFGGVDAIPMAIRAAGEDDVVNFAKMIEPSVAAINVEDIRTPAVFEITKRLKAELKIPVFHDDREGTAIVTRAGLINALKVVGKKLKTAKIVINGAGSAGMGIAEILLASNAGDIIICDTQGAIYEGRTANMNDFKVEIASLTNKGAVRGSLSDAVRGADVLIGVSSEGAFTSDMLKGMNDKAVVFAMANPYPEMDYAELKSAGAAVAATGRSDRPNQINNSLAFPGVFRGLLSARATSVTREMVIAASDAIASSVRKSELGEEYIIPRFGNHKEYVAMTAKVAASVAEAASKSGVARANVDAMAVKKLTKDLLNRYNRIEKNVERLNEKYG